jgi:hypothetical protein
MNRLFSGCHEIHQCVILTIAGYRYGMNGISNLDLYEHDFQVRHLNWFAYPGNDFGLSDPTGSIPAVPPTPYAVHYTAEASLVFPYANTANPLTIIIPRSIFRRRSMEPRHFSPMPQAEPCARSHLLADLLLWHREHRKSHEGVVLSKVASTRSPSSVCVPVNAWRFG